MRALEDFKRGGNGKKKKKARAYLDMDEIKSESRACAFPDLVSLDRLRASVAWSPPFPYLSVFLLIRLYI